MKVIYIGHSGFYIEFREHAFLIDYYKGRIPEIPEGKKLFVLASHAHSDHFTPGIFRLAGRKRICYLLSSDITGEELPEAELHFLEPGMQYRFPDGDDAVYVRTLKSTDEGVAFDIVCEGVRIYHAGDLNWWHWNEEGEEWNSWVKEAYQKEIDSLMENGIVHGGLPIHAAFLPLDPRQEDAFYLGFDYFMRNMGADYAFPMHFWQQPQIIGTLLERPESAPYRDRIMKLQKEGEEFSL